MAFTIAPFAPRAVPAAPQSSSRVCSARSEVFGVRGGFAAAPAAQKAERSFIGAAATPGPVAVMNTDRLLEEISLRANITKKEAKFVLTATLETIAEAVANGEKVTLPGFGSFDARVRKARTGRNPRTGETIEIPETRVPHFSAGKAFKDIVKNDE
eukprot:tig00000796_g4240.t1